VKSALLTPEGKPALAYMAMELEFVEGLDELCRLIDATVKRPGKNGMA